MTGTVHFYHSLGGTKIRYKSTDYKLMKRKHPHTDASVVRRSAPRKCGATSDTLTELDVYVSRLYTLPIWVTMPLEIASSAHHRKNTTNSSTVVVNY